MKKLFTLMLIAVLCISTIFAGATKETAAETKAEEKEDLSKIIEIMI